MQNLHAREWRRYGYGGPPEPWEHGAQRNLDRLATSYYLDILETRSSVVSTAVTAEDRARAEELFTSATRHKHEIDYTLRHWATPVEHLRVEDRLGSLMRIGTQMRDLLASIGQRPVKAAELDPAHLPAA